MVKKRYNWKSRQVVDTVIDDSATKKIQLDLPVEGRYDRSNELVLPSKKRRTKIRDAQKRTTRILSRKQRKKLEKIVEKKRKKENRASLLEALSKVQVSQEELDKLTSIASAQTKGLKRHVSEAANPEKTKKPKRDSQILAGEAKLDALSGATRLRLVDDPAPETDPNVVGFEESPSESESDAEVREPQTVEEEKPRIEEREPQTVESVARTPAVFVDVVRDAEIQKARLKLPILAEEQQVMEVINENRVAIVAGETGSGKTTQVPQFLYEAGYALEKQIAVTEPRRVAAISMSRRVAEEMGLTSREVSYLIRFEGNATDDTKIKFMTDGVLLKEVQSDFLLSKYSVVILDEAHERSVYTDILIGLLSRIVPLRHKKGDPLKLVIMSATLRIEDFTANRRLFATPPPVIKVDSRQFPVTVHFNKRTNEDYLGDAFEKAVKIHAKLPEGGILIFLTGQQEVVAMVNKLRKKFPLKIKNDETVAKRKKRKEVYAPRVNLDDYSVDFDDDDEKQSSDDDDEVTPVANQPLWVLPLYSMLPTRKQNEVFEPPPIGCRLCVVSTNVAETSLTIPNVKYVIDCGRSKRRLYDKVTGVTSYAVTWTSKASADQRAGRAGRTGPGHCYRLFSSAVFNDAFRDFDEPEIQQKPVDDLFLQMKCMNIDKVASFPFPTAPNLLQLKTAERRLEILGALKEGKVTPLGRAIAKFPVLPRFGKMLALSHQQDLLPYTVCLVAALSVQEVLLERPLTSDADDKQTRIKWAAVRRQWGGTGNSLLLGDNMVLLRAVGAAEFANSQNKLEKFCRENGLRQKAVIEIRKLRLQLTNEIRANLPEAELAVDPQLAPPTDLQAKLLRQILLAGMGDQIAKKREESGGGEFKYAYQANNMEEPVFLHSSSVLRRTLPEFVIYQEVYETNKIYMRGVTAIEPDWLPIYVPHLCNLGQPLSDPEPFYNASSGRVYCTVTGSFGSQAWSLPSVQIEHPRTVNYYKWFGRFFLEGAIFKKLGKYKEVLLSQPSIMVKSWAKLQPRTDTFLKALMSKEIVSKAKLEEVWSDSPKFLLEEYLRWLPQSAYGEVSLIWPPLD